MTRIVTNLWDFRVNSCNSWLIFHRDHAKSQRTDFVKAGNCFTEVSDLTALTEIADTLRSPDAIGHLEQVCERWIYSACLCFALTLEEQERTGFRYSYADYQLEYSQNLLFKRGGQMEKLFNGVIDRVRSTLDVAGNPKIVTRLMLTTRLFDCKCTLCFNCSASLFDLSTKFCRC